MIKLLQIWHGGREEPAESESVFHMIFEPVFCLSQYNIKNTSTGSFW